MICAARVWKSCKDRLVDKVAPDVTCAGMKFGILSSPDPDDESNIDTELNTLVPKFPIIHAFIRRLSVCITCIRHERMDELCLKEVAGKKVLGINPADEGALSTIQAAVNVLTGEPHVPPEPEFDQLSVET